MKSEIQAPKILEEKCTGCELCTSVCPAFVLEMRDGKAAVVRNTWCIGCDHCGAVCPTEAILHQGKGDEKERRPEVRSGPTVESLVGLFTERRSLRVYKKEPIPEGILNQVLEAGGYAPTGSNSQNVHYVVLTAPEQIDQLREMTLGFYDRIFCRVRSGFGRMMLFLVAGQRTVEYLRESLPKFEFANEKRKEGYDRLFYHAPVIMVTHAEAWDSSSAFNCSVALYQASLMAQALGLGCCFNGILVNAVNHDRSLKKWVGVPAGHRCYSAMTLGYPRVKYQRGVNRRPANVTWR